MGYEVRIKESTFVIPAENLDEAYNRMCQLNFLVPNAMKRGGSWGGVNDRKTAPEFGPHKGCWFSWIEWNYHEECKNAEEILQQLGFFTSTDEDGNLHIDNYDSKTGQEDLFLASISDLAKGYIIWIGEEDDLWGETYGGKFVVKKERNENYNDLIVNDIEEVNVEIVEPLSLSPAS